MFCDKLTGDLFNCCCPCSHQWLGHTDSPDPGTLFSMADFITFGHPGGCTGQLEYFLKYAMNTLGCLTHDRLGWDVLSPRCFPIPNTSQVKIKTKIKIFPYNFQSSHQLKMFMKTKVKKWNPSPENFPQNFLCFCCIFPLSASLNPQAATLTEHLFLVKHLAFYNQFDHLSPPQRLPLRLNLFPLDLQNCIVILPVKINTVLFPQRCKYCLLRQGIISCTCTCLV